eukprot:jgi/Ulvmu1/9399/UM051_0027.1
MCTTLCQEVTCMNDCAHVPSTVIAAARCGSQVEQMAATAASIDRALGVVACFRFYSIDVHDPSRQACHACHLYLFTAWHWTKHCIVHIVYIALPQCVNRYVDRFYALACQAGALTAKHGTFS